jgi:hypothetical protein
MAMQKIVARGGERPAGEAEERERAPERVAHHRPHASEIAHDAPIDETGGAIRPAASRGRHDLHRIADPEIE